MSRKTLNLDEKTHKLLKEFCDENALKMSPWVNLLIIKKLKQFDKSLPRNILKTK